MEIKGSEKMYTSVTLRIEVSEVTGLPGPLHTVASVFLPDANKLTATPVVIFAFPGGGYGRGYYFFDMPGSDFGGQAGYHLARHDWIFVACDPLGTGDSSIPDPYSLTLEAITAANKATVEHVMALLQSGELDISYPAVTGAVRIGLGQSMGAGFTILLEGTIPTFDGVCILGWSAIHTAPNAQQPPPAEGDPAQAFIETVRQASRREGFSRGFHYSDVPEDIIAADMTDYPVRNGKVPIWGSATIPYCARALLGSGALQSQAAAIETPVFVGVGEIDLVPDLRREPAAYAKSPDITVAAFPRMAHMHNFSPSRTLLWDRVAVWIDGVRRTAAESKARSRNVPAPDQQS